MRKRILVRIDWLIERLLDNGHHRQCDAKKTGDPKKCCCGYNLRLEVAYTASKLRRAIDAANLPSGQDVKAKP